MNMIDPRAASATLHAVATDVRRGSEFPALRPKIERHYSFDSYLDRDSRAALDEEILAVYRQGYAQAVEDIAGRIDLGTFAGGRRRRTA